MASIRFNVVTPRNWADIVITPTEIKSLHQRDPTYSVTIPHKDIADLKIEHRNDYPHVIVYTTDGRIISLPRVVDPHDMVYQWKKLYNKDSVISAVC